MKLKCLLIDDDPEDHEIFLLALQNIDADISCSIEIDARQALNKLRDRLLVPDYVFVDMNMPRMNGREFIIEMRKFGHLKDTRLVAYSTSSLEEKALLELGASQFITKAVDIPRLSDSLLACFNHTVILT